MTRSANDGEPPFQVADPIRSVGPVHSMEFAIPTPAEHAERKTEELRLALEIADASARTDLESWCERTPDTRDGWYDIAPGRLFDDYEVSAIAKAVKYLSLRGQLEVDPVDPQRVRVKA